MNVRGGSQGQIYTAESEGIVRAFDKEGKPLGVLGSVKITGGCKNVAIAVSPNGNTVYFCDQPGSKIHIMARKPEAVKGSE
jgi:sugar lactone lactonase YvrE